MGQNTGDQLSPGVINKMHIIELRLQARDLKAQRQFYRDVLTLPVQGGTDGPLIVGAGRTRLIFEAAEAGTAPVYHFAFNIPENRFVEARRWIAARTPLLRRGKEDEFHFIPWNAHACYFTDAAGNILEFIARHNLPNASSEPFDGRGILEVSEIGLPGTTVGEMVAMLEAGPGLALWSGDRESFAAVGDACGLCIIVPTGHRWLPDKRIPAAPHPVALTIAGDRDAAYAIPGYPYRINMVQM